MVSVLVVVDNGSSIISYRIPYILVRVIFPFPFIHISHHGFRILSRQYHHFSTPSVVKISRRPDRDKIENERASARSSGRSRRRFDNTLPCHGHDGLLKQVTPCGEDKTGRDSGTYEGRRTLRF